MHWYFLISLFGACIYATSKPDADFIPKKKSLLVQDSMEQNLICPSFADGLFILLQPVPLSQAANACLQFGLGLANLTFSNNFIAAQLLSTCGASVGWLSSFEEIRSDTCVALTNQGNIFYPEGEACVSAANVPVCQDFANTIVSTATTTFTFCTQGVTTVITNVIGTVTTTVTSTTISTNTGGLNNSGCIGMKCMKTKTATLTPPASTVIVTMTAGVSTIALKAQNGSNNLIPVISPIEKIMVSTIVNPVTVTFVPPVPDNDCPANFPSCGANIGVGEFVLLKSYVPFSQAACACNRAGMQVASIEDENLIDATNALFRCGGAFSSAWIQSVNGNDHEGLCLALSVNDAAPGGKVNYPGSCSNGLPILCQRRPINWTSNNFVNRHKDDDKVAGKRFQPKNGNPLPPPIAFNEKSRNLSPKQKKLGHPKSPFLNPPSNFAQRQNPVYSLCSSTQNSLFIVMSQAFLPNQNYAAACAQFNLVPANIFPSNRGAAGVIFGICSSGDPNAVAAMANSFEALQGSVCDLVDDTGAILIVDSNSGNVASNCVTQRYFLCQATNAPTQSKSTIFTGPFVFQTTTTVATTAVSVIGGTTTRVVSSGTTTTTTTAIEFISLTITTTKSVATTTTVVTLTNSIFTVTETTTSTVTPVAPTCPLMLLEKAPEHKGFVVLIEKASYWEAECACSSHGLKLAELDVTNFTDAIESIQKALGVAQRAWIHKYGSEVFGKQCLALYSRNTHNIGGSVQPMYCDAPIPIVCQKP
jgi:hypothetical protein